MNRTKIYILLFLIALLVITTIQPIYGFDMWLQHVGSVLLFVLLFIDARKGHLRLSSYIGIALFTAIHIFGARWLYTMVPYDDWCQNLLNWSPNDTFGWERNHYDRMVHFMFGLSILSACFDWYLLKLPKGISYKYALILAWMSIQVFSLIYELFEWGLTFALSPESVESYNGQQGDMWDPHKDMALAFLGSSVSALIIYLKHKKMSRKTL